MVTSIFSMRRWLRSGIGLVRSGCWAFCFGAGLVGPSLYAQPPAAVTPAVPSPLGSEVLRQLEQQHQICILVGEGFANRLVEVETVDEGPLQSMDQGVFVRGNQRTTATTSLDAVANPNVASFQFLLNGATQHRTVAQTQQATVHLDGTSQFQLAKQVDFDGKSITTRSPSAHLLINQRPVGAMTPVSGIPVIGRIATQTVLNAVEQRRPSTERLTARRVTDHVGPRFNSEVDQELTTLNQRLVDAGQKLELYGLNPATVRSRSTDDALLWAASYRTLLDSWLTSNPADAQGNSTDSLARRPVVTPTRETHVRNRPWRPTAHTQLDNETRDQLLIVLHESIVEDIIRRFSLAGKRVSDTSLNRLLAGELSAPLNDPPQMATLVLDVDHPVRARFDGEEILIELRVAFELALGATIPTQIVTVAVTPELRGDQIQLRSEYRSMTAADPSQAAGLSNLVEPIIRQKMEEGLKDRTIPASFDLPARPGQAQIKVIPRSLSLQEGRLKVVFEPLVSTNMTSRPQPVMPAERR